MARRRAVVGTTIRNDLVDLEQRMHEYATSVGDLEAARLSARRIADLTASRPVVVHHGFEIDVYPDAGPFIVFGDGTVGALEPQPPTVPGGLT